MIVRDFILGPMLFVFSVTAGIAGALFLMTVLWLWLVGPRACAEFSEAMNARVEYKFWQGCFVTMPDGNVLPEDVAKDVMRQKFGFEINKGQ